MSNADEPESLDVGFVPEEGEGATYTGVGPYADDDGRQQLYLAIGQFIYWFSKLERQSDSG